VQEYFKIQGYYLDLVQLDKVYYTRENRKWLKERNIIITASQLGRKPKKEKNQYQKVKRKSKLHTGIILKLSLAKLKTVTILIK